MKKLLFLLGGGVTLTACSEDAYQEAEMQNEEAGSQYQTNSFNDNGSGGFIGGGLSTLAINYHSPWDIWWNRGSKYYDMQPSYVISNGIDEESTSPYTIHVHSWVGLAYFDGNNNGTFVDHTTGNSFTLNIANYPNLFVNGEEVGNLVRTTTSLDFLPQEGARIEDLRDHLPMPNGTAPRYTNTSPPWPFWQWSGGFDCTGTLTPQEELLLRDYGKVFFYEVDVFEAATNAFVGTYILHPEIQTLPAGPAKKWEKVPNVAGTAQLQGSLPFGNFNLHYYTDGSLNRTYYDNTTGGFGNKCNSFELVFDTAGIIKHQHTITGSVTKTLSMEIWQDVPTFWQRSALYLRVY